MPWSTRRCWAGSILGTPPWWRSKQSPFGVIIPYSSWSGANVVAAVFVARTSRYRRTTCFSYSDGNPYGGERIGAPCSFIQSGTASGAFACCAPASAGISAGPAIALSAAPPLRTARLLTSRLREFAPSASCGIMNLRCSISVPGILKAATWAEAWLADAPDRPNPTSLSSATSPATPIAAPSKAPTRTQPGVNHHAAGRQDDVGCERHQLQGLPADALSRGLMRRTGAEGYSQ